MSEQASEYVSQRVVSEESRNHTSAFVRLTTEIRKDTNTQKEKKRYSDIDRRIDRLRKIEFTSIHATAIYKGIQWASEEWPQPRQIIK